MNDMDDRIKIIADHYGIEKQTLQACEELAELMKAIIKRSKSRNSAEFDNLIEELADAKIMIDQIKYLNHIGDEIIDEVVDEKLTRQLERIKNE